MKNTATVHPVRVEHSKRLQTACSKFAKACKGLETISECVSLANEKMAYYDISHRYGLLGEFCDIFPMWAAWHATGRKVITFDEQLLQQANTCNSVTVSYAAIKLSFPCFYIDLFGKEYYVNEKPLHGIYVVATDTQLLLHFAIDKYSIQSIRNNSYHLTLNFIDSSEFIATSYYRSVSVSKYKFQDKEELKKVLDIAVGYLLCLSQSLPIITINTPGKF